MITKRACVGFILLAAIVFLTSQYTFDQMQGIPITQGNSVTGFPLQHPGEAITQTVVYRPPIIALGNNGPAIITVVIELFAFICYLILKLLEPKINSAAESMVESMRSCACDRDP